MDDVALVSGERTQRGWGQRLSGVLGAGVAGWVVDVVVLWVAHEVLGIHAVVAAAAGFIAAGVTNFLINRLVFSGAGGRTPRQAWRYAVLFGANLPVVSFGVPLAGELVEDVADGVPAPLVVGKVIVTALMVPVNAYFYGAWVFKD